MQIFFSEIHVVRTKVDIFDYITSLKNVKKLKKVFYYLIHLLCYIVWLNIYLIRYFSDNVVVRFILSLLEYDYSQYNEKQNIPPRRNSSNIQKNNRRKKQNQYP